VSLADLRRFADGQPVDALAAERYAEHPPAEATVLKMCRSKIAGTRKAGRLRAAALLAARAQSATSSQEVANVAPSAPATDSATPRSGR
jgi:hypothetical protein